MFDETFGLLVAFDDESPAFTNGFEAGTIWSQMGSGTVSEIEATTHTENREVIKRMAASAGWSIECKPTETEGWDMTILRKVQAPSRPKLRVVS